MKLNLTAQTGIAISALVTVLVCGFGAYEYLSQQQTWRRQLDQRAALTMDRVVHSAENSLWAMDMVQLEAVLQAEMQDVNLESIVVKEGADKQLKLSRAFMRGGDGKAQVSTNEPPLAAITLSKPILHENAQLGLVTLNFSTAGLRAQSRQLLLSKVGEVLVLNMGLAISVLLVMRYRLVRPLNRIISELEGAAASLSGSISAVSRNSQALADSSREQAASLEQTSASLQQLSSMTRRNAESSECANASMQQEVARNFQGIQERLGRMDQAMNQTLVASQETAKIVKTIDGIAFLTNLLALNAAVEAARAGESGAGFAVVADEVRRLAVRSAEAAKSIQQLLENSTARLQETAGHFREVGTAMDSNARLTRKVCESVAEISTASHQQAEGIQQLNLAVGQLDKATQGNAGNAEESAEVAQRLRAQAEALKQAVGDLLGLVGGAARAAQAVPVACGEQETAPSEARAIRINGVPRGRNDTQTVGARR